MVQQNPKPSDLPPVAVITPYYNTGPIFAETIASVLAQSLHNWEWVVVDDGSTDTAALATLAELRRRADPRIRLIDLPHLGLPAARNAGVAASSAPLLFFLDSDDLLAPTALEKLAWLLHSDERPAFATAWNEVFGSEQISWRRGFETRDHFLFENMATPATMMRRSVFEAVGGFDETRTGGLEDYELWLRCAAHGHWGRDIHEPLIAIRRKAATAYPGYAWPTRDDPQHLARFRHEMRRRYPQLYRTGLPTLPATDERPFADVPQIFPFANSLPLHGRRRLLLLLPDLDHGGVSSFALAMLEQLTAHGYSCTVATTMPGNHPLREAFARHAAVFVLDAFLRRADVPRFLHYLIESRHVDAVLLSNSVTGYRLLPYLRAHCGAVALIDYNHMRDPDTANGGSPGFGAAYDPLLDLHLTSSANLRDWMVAHGASPSRSHVVYTAVDTARWRPNAALRATTRAELRVGDVPLLLYPARLTVQKQPWLFARVLALLQAQGIPFRCVVAGDGPDRPALARFLRRNGLLERVQLLGMVDAERMQALMAASDILFLPSAYEGLALVLYEAMASGVVPVSVASGGQAELVTPDCGILVPADERQEQRYAAALEWLIRAPRQRQAMAQACRHRSTAQFSSAAMGARLATLIDAACQGVGQAPRETVGQGAATVAASLAVEELRHFQRNHRFRVARLAWTWWKQYGRAGATLLVRGRERLVLRTYPLRLLVRRLRGPQKRTRYD